jgi:hypothetical protein
MEVVMQIKNRQQLLMIVAGVAFGLLLGDALVFSPLVKLWQTRSARIAELQKKVKDGDALLRRDAAIQTRWSQMRANTLTHNPSLAEQQVLGAFDDWSRKARISVNSITPQWKRENDDYTTLECRVDASGSVGTLRSFLFEMENNPMALKIESMEITSRDKDGQQLSLGLQISGLMLSSTEDKR